MTTNDNVKRRYVKPAFRTVELFSNRSMILCGSSDGMAGRGGYTPDDISPFGGG